MWNQQNLGYLCLWIAGILMVGVLLVSLIAVVEVGVLPVVLCMLLAATGVLLITFGPDDPEPRLPGEPPKDSPR
jgi:hypothetical protein